MPLDAPFAIATGRCSLVQDLLMVSSYMQSATNVALDWILVLLPIPAVLGAIMDTKTRLAIIGILVLGVG
jgi:hypothetical protein